MDLQESSFTEKNYVTVYNATITPKKPKRRDKSDLGPDFVAPDGDWGWVVCIAAGLSNLAMYPPLQQYGLIYRQRMVSLGFSAKETTTIVNILLSLSSLVGIVNGAMFRRFSFRQVAITGSILIFSGILFSAWCTTFWQYVLCVSVIYGIGQGLNISALSLAVNTYFKNRRRRATGFTWTITGLGPIIFPHFTSLILIYYGGQGTILIYAGISLNSLMCAMTLQPVLWHTRKPDNFGKNAENESAKPLEVVRDKSEELLTSELEYECKYCQYKKRVRPSIDAPQFDFDDNDSTERLNYQITETGTPLMTRAKDGWFGSKTALGVSRQTENLRNKIARQASTKDLEDEKGESENAKLHDSKMEKACLTNSQHFLNDKRVAEFHCTCAEEKALLQKHNTDTIKREQERLSVRREVELLYKRKISFKEKVVKFFDLDLLKDFTFINLVMGMTLMMFAEVNFSVLIPFILDQYGYSNEQISTAMSMLGGMDICVRFLAPFALERVKLSNQVLFAFGILILTLGRLLITLTDSYHVTLALFLLIGFGKGFRTIFSSLIIPSYVPLKRLPAASGLQLVCNTLFSLSFGPIIGVITDATSYTMAIHFLNLLTSLALIIWLLEYLVRRILGKEAKTTMDS